MPISVTGTTSRLHEIAPTTLPSSPEPTLPGPLSATYPSPITDPEVDQTPPNHTNIGLFTGIIVAVLVVAIIITLALVLGLAVCMRNHKNKVPMVTNEAYGTGLQDTTVYTEGDTYDYPSMDDQAIRSIDTKPNEAYAASIEAKPCVAYATNSATERNNTSGIGLQDVVMYRDGNTYDYPTMDDQVGEYIEIKQNEAYATNINTKAP